MGESSAACHSFRETPQESDLASVGLLGPPARAGNHSRLDQVGPVEEPHDLLAGPQGHPGRALLVPELDRLDHRLGVDLGGGVRDHQVAAGRHGVQELAHDRLGLAGVQDEIQDPQHQTVVSMAACGEPGAEESSATSATIT
jgi:hypothetical protein